MKKARIKRLKLNRETLTDSRMGRVGGGETAAGSACETTPARCGVMTLQNEGCGGSGGGWTAWTECGLCTIFI